jgi:heme-degrading monooxygenase HmoA
MTIVSVLRLPVRAEDAARFAGRFHELEVFERSAESGGFLAGRLLRPLAEGAPFLVIAEWEHADAYRAWLDNPVRAELAGRIEPLLTGEVVPGELFEEAL